MSDESEAPERLAYQALAQAVLRDEHRDVDVTADGLFVRGKLFAFLDGAELVVTLPEARAADLRERGIAVGFDVVGHVNNTWVRVRESGLWPEMAREAHRHVGHPPLGGDS